MAHVHKPVRMPGAEIAAALHAHSKQPFQEILAAMLGAQPSSEALQRFANRYPDRWARAIGICAGLCGFEKGVGMTVNAYNVATMSDAELMTRLSELQQLSASTGAMSDKTT